ncbi:hypothetical protein Scep_019926 [Stephania cephalantha]|uniref:Uncharacterized protein n=1 Tax=Stephania cephalantha TaxID=152367 RepID=A0AAP0IBX6_9MAGN
MAITAIHRLQNDSVVIPKYGYQFISSDAIYVRVNDNTTLTGELYFSSTSATRIYINIEVPHVKSLADRFSMFAPKTKRIESKEAIHIYDEEDMIKNRKRITDILQMEWVDDQQVNDDGKEFHVVQDTFTATANDKVSSKVCKFTFINSDEESCE